MKRVLNVKQSAEGYQIVKFHKSQLCSVIVHLNRPIHRDDFGEVESSRIGVVDPDVSVDGRAA
jgi:hypothetical protein